MSEQSPYALGDTIEVDGVEMHIDELIETFSGRFVHAWWLDNSEMHEVRFSVAELWLRQTTFKSPNR